MHGKFQGNDGLQKMIEALSRRMRPQETKGRLGSGLMGKDHGCIQLKAAYGAPNKGTIAPS